MTAKTTPLALSDLETIVKEIQADIQVPGTLHKFQASQPLTADMELMAEHREVCFTIQVSVRAWGTPPSEPLEAVRQHGPETAEKSLASGEAEATQTRPRQTSGWTPTTSALYLKLRNVGNTCYINTLVHIISWLLERTASQVTCLGLGQHAWRAVLMQRKAFVVHNLFGVGRTVVASMTFVSSSPTGHAGCSIHRSRGHGMPDFLRPAGLAFTILVIASTC